jgi:hypothetical protein
VLGEDRGDEGLELLEIVGVGGGAALLAEGLLERAALVHSRGGDNAAMVGDCFQSCEFSWGQLFLCHWCMSPEKGVTNLGLSLVILHAMAKVRSEAKCHGSRSCPTSSLQNGVGTSFTMERHSDSDFVERGFDFHAN